MILIEHLESFFAWLLTASWQASVLAILVLATQWLLGKWLNPRWRHALWLLVVLRLLLPSLPESMFSVFQFTPSPPLALEISTTTPLFVSEPVISTPKENPAPFVHLFTFFSLLALIWLVGAAALAIATWMVNRRFALEVKKSPPISDAEVIRLFEESKAELHVRRTTRLVENPRVESPAIMGLFTPTLILPANVQSRFDATELRLIFLHELAHLKRGDVIAQALIALLQIAHWFNPVLWFAFRRMRIDREPATDALVLSRAGESEKERYGLMLIKLLEHFNQRHSLATLVGILEDKDQFKRRFSLIARFTRGAYGWSLLGVLLIALLGIACLTKSKAAEAPKVTEPTGPSKGANSKSVIFDQVNFDQVDIKTVLQTLAAKSKGLVPDKKGLHFALRLFFQEAEDKPKDSTVDPRIHPLVTLHATNISLDDLLDRLTTQTGLQHDIDPTGSIYLWPPAENSNTFADRTYWIPPNGLTGSFPPPPPGAQNDSSLNRQIDVKKNLVDRGILFPDGAFATFSPTSARPEMGGKLQAHDTIKQLDELSLLLDRMTRDVRQSVEMKPTPNPTNAPAPAANQPTTDATKKSSAISVAPDNVGLVESSGKGADPSTAGTMLPSTIFSWAFIEVDDKAYQTDKDAMDRAVRDGDAAYFGARKEIVRSADLQLIEGQPGWVSFGTIESYVDKVTNSKDPATGKPLTTLSANSVFLGVNGDFKWSADHQRLDSSWQVTAPVGFDKMPDWPDHQKPRFDVTTYTDTGWDMTPGKPHGSWVGESHGWAKIVSGLMNADQKTSGISSSQQSGPFAEHAKLDESEWQDAINRESSSHFAVIVTAKPAATTSSVAPNSTTNAGSTVTNNDQPLMTVRTFLPPPNFIPGEKSNSPNSPPNEWDGVKEQLILLGIHFPADASATFVPATGKLVVRDTPEELDRIQDLITKASAAASTPSIQIDLKVAEIDDDVYRANKKKVDAAIEKADFAFFNNLKGVSLMSTPSVTTKPGLKANIDIVREFPYPTAFDGTGHVVSDLSAQTVLSIPPTPREFVTKDLGVSAEITPIIAQSNSPVHGKIVLNGTFSVVDFEGLTKSTLGPQTPTFETRETHFFEALADNQEIGLLIPGIHGDEQTIADKDNAGKTVSVETKTDNKRLILFLGAKLVD